MSTKQPVILTISILISNRPKTVRKCLDSIKPILDSINAELILTDTGCSTEVRKIIEEYTDNIIDFQWCNNFSKARNVGLKRAKGEWFLFLDDDEWFEDVTEIIDFFQSGEYRKYGFAVYTQRNYLNLKGTEYTDLTVPRVTKLEADIHFEYSIHECFNHIPGKTKVFHSYVHHYGYAYQTEEEKMAHAKRNISLLVEEHKKEPGNLKHILQLAQEYNSIHDWNSSLSIAEEGILYDQQGKSTQRFCRNSLYVNVIDCYMEYYEYDKVLEIGKKYLETAKLDILAITIIWGRMAAAYLEQQKYQDAVYAVQQYWKGYKEWQKNPDSFLPYITTVTSDGLEMRNRNIIVGVAVQALMYLNHYKEANEWLEKIDWLEKNLIVDKMVIDVIVNSVTETEGEEYEIVLQMCKRILTREALEGYVIRCIELRSQLDKSRSKIENLLCYSRLTGNSSFFEFLHVINTIYYAADSKQIEEELLQLCKYYIEECFITLIEYQVWNKAVEKGVNLANIIEKIPFTSWDAAVKQYCTNEDWDTLEIFHLFLASHLSQESFNWKSWNNHYSWRKIQVGIEKNLPTGLLVEFLKSYAENIRDLYFLFYQENIFQERQDILPKECQAALSILQWYQMIEVEKYTEAVEYLKELKKQTMLSNLIIRTCSEWIRIQIEKQTKEHNEFFQLAKMIKRKATQFIIQKQYNNAKMVLLQLQEMLPDDQEVKELLKQVEKE